MESEQKIKEIIENDVSVEGHLHYAPHHRFTLPSMIAPTQNSPYINGFFNKKARTVQARLAVPKRNGQIMVVLSDGMITYSDMRLGKGEWLADVWIENTVKGDEEAVMWFIHDLQSQRGLG